MAHVFLSAGWLDEVDRLQEAADLPVPDSIKDIVINVEVSGGPDGDVAAHLKAGRFKRGRDEAAPTTLRIPFDIARRMLVEGDQNAAMQAFMSGQIKVEGDMTKVMAMQSGGPPSDAQKKLEVEIRSMTE